MTLTGPWPAEEPTPEQSSEELGTAEEMEAHHTEQPPVLPSSKEKHATTGLEIRKRRELGCSS